MTTKEKAIDLKSFQELVKTEVAKQGNYDTACNVMPGLEMHTILTALENAVHNVNFCAVYHNETVIELCGKLAAQALVLASNSQRALDKWEEMRA